MIRFFIPLILVVGAVGMFAAYTNPTYQEIKSLQQQGAQYDEALSTLQTLIGKLSTLADQENAMTPTDLTRVSEVLPDNVNNIRLIININNIAARHGLKLGSVDIGSVTGATQTGGTTPAPTDQSGPIGSASVSFSVTTNNYDNFLAFVGDLEHSLRLVDITKLSFSSPQSAAGPVTYSLGVRTYWLH